MVLKDWTWDYLTKKRTTTINRVVHSSVFRLVFHPVFQSKKQHQKGLKKCSKTRRNWKTPLRALFQGLSLFCLFFDLFFIGFSFRNSVSDTLFTSMMIACGMYCHTSHILLSSSPSPSFNPHAPCPTLTMTAGYVGDIKGMLPLTSLFAHSQAAAACPCWWHSHHMSKCNHGYPECDHKHCQNVSPNGNCNLNPNTNPNVDMKLNRNASPNASHPTMNTPMKQVTTQVPVTPANN